MVADAEGRPRESLDRRRGAEGTPARRGRRSPRRARAARRHGGRRGRFPVRQGARRSRPGDLHRQGSRRTDRRGRPQRARVARGLRRRARAGTGAQPREGLGRRHPGAGPARPDPRRLRAARALPGSAHAGRARAAPVPPAAAGRPLRPSLASGRRHRRTRGRRAEARARPAAHPRPRGPPAAGSPEDRSRPARAAPRPEASPAGRDRGLHQRRQDDALQPARERLGLCRRPPLRDARRPRRAGGVGQALRSHLRRHRRFRPEAADLSRGLVSLDSLRDPGRGPRPPRRGRVLAAGRRGVARRGRDLRGARRLGRQGAPRRQQIRCRRSRGRVRQPSTSRL